MHSNEPQTRLRRFKKCGPGHATQGRSVAEEPGDAKDGPAFVSACAFGAPTSSLASYLYYVHDLSLLSDTLYDRMASDMLSRWDEIEHRHKHVITEEDLQAGSLYALSAREYPLITRHSAMELAKTEWGVLINPNRDCA